MYTGMALAAFVVIAVSVVQGGASTPTYPFRALGSKIIDAQGTDIQFRCVNWAGHMEGNVPEGLGSASLENIVATLASEPTWNCVRLTYAVELFDKADLTLTQSFTSGNNNASTDLSPLLVNVTHYNPTLVDIKLTGVFEAVVEELEKAGLFVLMSNHVSKASWCCGDDDGNGWFGDEWFDVQSWTDR